MTELPAVGADACAGVARLSLGGNIAQELVRRNNHSVQALVSADATRNTAARHPMAALLGVAAIRWRAAAAGPAFALQAARVTATDPRVQQYALEANGHRSNDEIVGILASLLTDALRPDSDYRLPVPTLLVYGELDRIGDIAHGTQAWARRDALAEYAVIPGAGHASNLDNPEAFTEVLETFLGRVLPPGSCVAVDAGFPGHQGPAEAVAGYRSRPRRLLPERNTRALPWAGDCRHRR